MLTADTIDEVLLRLLEEVERGARIGFTFEPGDTPPALFSVRDCEPEEPEHEDADVLPRLGKGILIRSTARILIAWEKGDYREIVKMKVGDDEIEKFWRKNREALEESCQWASLHTNLLAMERTPVSAAHYAFSKVNGRESAESFLYPLGSLVGLSKHCPALTLGHKLMWHQRNVALGKAEEEPNESIVVLLTRAYVDHLRGKSISKMRFPTDWKTPAIPRIA